jgi:hypothetical protein
MLAIHPSQVPVINAAFVPGRGRDRARAGDPSTRFSANPGAARCQLDGADDRPAAPRAGRGCSSGCVVLGGALAGFGRRCRPRRIASASAPSAVADAPPCRLLWLSRTPRVLERRLRRDAVDGSIAS